VTLLEAVLVIVAGLAAGTINAIVGSGTLVTFPALLAVGYPPVMANVSNSLGLVPGNFAAAYGYRAEIGRHRGRLVPLAAAAGAGGLAGAVALLSLPASVFDVVVPGLIALALVLIVVQPRLSRALAARGGGGAPRERPGALLLAGVFGTGVYGGYFGAAQGIVLLAVLAIALQDELPRLNGLKNLLVGLVNGVAAIVFVVAADVAWLPVGLIAIGATMGGTLGARVGRRLSPAVLRGLIVLVGLAAIGQLVL
jgi:uncharacterized membrane protein YfcA